MTERAETAGIDRVLIAGLCTLIVAMGIGRFAYTPLLPGMQAALDIDNPGAGLLASLNYVGYLAGALAAGFMPHGAARRQVFRAALAVSVATTGLMAATTWFAGFGLFRLASGLASGVLFVFSADMVGRALARAGQSWRMGWHFSGVGIGIAATGLLVPVLHGLGDWRAGWAGLAVLAAVCAVPAWLWLRDDRAAPEPAGGGAPQRPLVPLAVLIPAYFLEGFGYIVSGTFLVAILQAGAVGGIGGSLAWAVVGIAAAPSCILWMAVARRSGFVTALVAAHLIQAVGIVIPALSTDPASAVAAAVMFGGTFMGITTLVIALVRPSAGGARAIGLLTASFGLGQIVGPVVAGWLARGGGFEPALILAALAVAAGGVLIAIGSAATRFTRRKEREPCPM